MPYVIVLLISLIAAMPSQAFQRIVSINLCTDLLLYQLADRSHIVSLSYLGGDREYSPIADKLDNVVLNHSLVEEIIPLKPDLVLAGKYSDPHTVFFLKQMGIKVVQLAIPFSVKGMEQPIMELGQLLGKEKKAKALLADMHRRVAAVEQSMQSKSRPLVLTVAPSGYTHGKYSMQGDIIEMAGFRNLAAQVGIQGSGYISLEQMIKYQPDYIISQYSIGNTNSLAQRLLLHPAFTQGLPNTKAIHVPSNLWSCASPYMIDALEILAKAHPDN